MHKIIFTVKVFSSHQIYSCVGFNSQNITLFSCKLYNKGTRFYLTLKPARSDDDATPFEFPWPVPVDFKVHKQSFLM
jgi:hypothetical protein